MGNARPAHYGPTGFEIIYFFLFYGLNRREILSEFRFIKNDFRKNAIKLIIFSFLYRRVTFHQKIDKIKNQKIKNKIFGLQGHVIPR